MDEFKAFTLLQPNTYALRIAKCHAMELHKTFNLFASRCAILIVSEEGTGSGYHQHLYCVGENLDRKVLVKAIKDTYPDAKGNKCMYIRSAQDPKQLMKYTLKEGKFLYKGVPDVLINKMKVLSTRKTDLKSEVVTLEERFVLGELELDEFMVEYLNLKVKHSQNIYDNHLQAYFTRMALWAQKLKVSDYVQRFEKKMFYVEKEW